MTAGTDVYLHGISGALPEKRVVLESLEKDGLISSPVSTLKDYGFDHARVAEKHDQSNELAREAAENSLESSGFTAGEIDMLIWASARPQNHIRHSSKTENDNPILGSFQYQLGWLQDELDLSGVETLGITQQGCASMFQALRTAVSRVRAEPEIEQVLCVSFDVLPPDSSREIFYNVISDGASACIVSMAESVLRWSGSGEITKGYYRDPDSQKEEILATYFPTAKACIEQTLQRYDFVPGDLDAIVPSGIHRNSWDVLLDLLNLPEEHLLLEGEPFGHTITSDNFIYLDRLAQNGRIPEESILLLFTYGFGSSWNTILLSTGA